MRRHLPQRAEPFRDMDGPSLALLPDKVEFVRAGSNGGSAEHGAPNPNPRAKGQTMAPRGAADAGCRPGFCAETPTPASPSRLGLMRGASPSGKSPNSIRVVPTNALSGSRADPGDQAAQAVDELPYRGRGAPEASGARTATPHRFELGTGKRGTGASSPDPSGFTGDAGPVEGAAERWEDHGRRRRSRGSARQSRSPAPLTRRAPAMTKPTRDPAYASLVTRADIPGDFPPPRRRSMPAAGNRRRCHVSGY